MKILLGKVILDSLDKIVASLSRKSQSSSIDRNLFFSLANFENTKILLGKVILDSLDKIVASLSRKSQSSSIDRNLFFLRSPSSNI